MRTLVLGMGNPILSDDGVGIRVAHRLQGRIIGVDVIATPIIGLNLLDIVDGYSTLFVIDAFIADPEDEGKLRKSSLGDGSLHLFSSHGLDFHQLLLLGKQLGYRVPEVAGIYGIGISGESPFGLELSFQLARETHSIVDRIIDDIKAVLDNRHSNSFII